MLTHNSLNHILKIANLSFKSTYQDSRSTIPRHNVQITPLLIISKRIFFFFIFAYLILFLMTFINLN
jgi:hypothetical protein